MGLFPDPALEDRLRRVAGLPRRPKVQFVGPTGEPVSSTLSRLTARPEQRRAVEVPRPRFQGT